MTSSVTQGTGRPKGYYLANGTRVASVTTITGYFKTRQLMVWANNEGLAGRGLDEQRDKAAEAGSLCHLWIEDHIHGRESNFEPVWEATDEMIEQAQIGFSAFKEWADQVKLTVLETETPLVSEEYGYGGTFDARALVGGTLKLLDWKTSGGVYPSMLAQLAAYRQLLIERDGDSAPDSAQLLRIGKTHADFHLHSYPESVLDEGWEWFLHARGLYNLEKKLKKVAA